MKRVSATLKGIIIGVIICVTLETAMILFFGFMTSRGIMHLAGLIGALTYYVPLVTILVVSGSVGLTIASRSRDFKKLSTILSVAMALVLGSNYMYFWWWWNSNIQHFLIFDASV